MSLTLPESATAPQLTVVPNGHSGNKPAHSVQSTSQVPRPTGVAHSQVPLLETAHVWGLDFARVTMQQTIAYADALIQGGECQYMITANLNYVMLTHQQPRLQPVNRGAAAILADGNPIVWRSRLLSEPLPQRVAGSDMIVELARLAERRGYRMFFLGAAPGVAARAADQLREQFPDLCVAGCLAPPFRELTSEEQQQMLDTIRIARPDILLVAFGQPKGELWIHQHYAQLGVPLSIQLGASFDFLAGTAQRAPRFWQALGCEWLYRSLKEPRRLAPRYARNIRFLCTQVLADLRGLL
jgi:N-acetylglucosaminyldiphosphoundecaprenol N-acetyl-beta-D-mannosaminyltransferase